MERRSETIMTCRHDLLWILVPSCPRTSSWPCLLGWKCIDQMPKGVDTRYYGTKR